jgi:hypothetical protein
MLLRQPAKQEKYDLEKTSEPRRRPASVLGGRLRFAKEPKKEANGT